MSHLYKLATDAGNVHAVPSNEWLLTLACTPSCIVIFLTTLIHSIQLYQTRICPGSPHTNAVVVALTQSQSLVEDIISDSDSLCSFGLQVRQQGMSMRCRMFLGEVCILTAAAQCLTTAA